MSRWFLLALGIVLALTAQECEFDLGEFNRYVVSYELRVTNSSPNSLAVVTVTMKGTSRSATLGKGKSLSVIGFSGGEYTVKVGHTGLRLAHLLERRKLAASFLDTWRNLDDPARVAEVEAEIKGFNQTIKVLESGASGNTCKGTIKPNRTATVVLSEFVGKWAC